jgi:hypothetical protein
MSRKRSAYLADDSKLSCRLCALIIVALSLLGWAAVLTPIHLLGVL